MTIDAADTAVVRTSDGATMLVHRDDLILPLRKQPNTMFPSIVLIGRASSNDVVLPYTSVSKLHARFEPGRPATLCDAASSNGTTLGGRALAPNVATPVSSGAPITLAAALFKS